MLPLCMTFALVSTVHYDARQELWLQAQLEVYLLVAPSKDYASRMIDQKSKVLKHTEEMVAAHWWPAWYISATNESFLGWYLLYWSYDRADPAYLRLEHYYKARRILAGF